MIARCSLMSLLVFAACDDMTRASEPVWNKQACAHCHMLLSEPRYAAQLVTRTGERLYFDDVGCMASFMAKAATNVAHAWVHVAGKWSPIASARFARSASTPMGFGFVADNAGSLDFSAVERAVSEKTSTSAGAPR